MDPKKPRREEKEEETPAVLKIEDMMFEIALGLSIPEILKWCMVNKSFGKMCKKKFPPEKLYELVLVDLEVLLNESIAVTERQDQTAEQAELERRKKVEHRMKEIIEMATSVNTDLPFHNMPKALALHRMMLHTEESRRFFLERLDIYFGIGSDKDWEKLPKESKVTNNPPWLVKASNQEWDMEFWETTHNPRTGQIDFNWFGGIDLDNEEPLDLEYDWKQKEEGLHWKYESLWKEAISHYQEEIKGFKSIVAVFPRGAEPTKKDAHVILELFEILNRRGGLVKAVAYMSAEDKEMPIAIGIKELKQVSEGQSLGQEWEMQLWLHILFFPKSKHLVFKPINAYINMYGSGTTSSVDKKRAWFSLGPAFTEPFVSEMLVNSNLRKQLVFPEQVQS